MDPERVRSVERVPHGSSDDPEILDFSANTNHDAPEGVQAVYESAWDEVGRYPPEPPEAYCRRAAEYVGCEPEMVVPTPGGLAAIRLAIEVTVTAGESVLVPAPSFGEYEREVRLQGATPTFVSHDELLDADPADHALAIACNPNNPTGTLYEAATLRTFAERCREAGTPFLVDEAFLGFTDEESLAGTPGVIVARSLTKLFGLPGLRAGFAVATGANLDALRTARRTWNLGIPALAVGSYCLQQDAFVTETRERVRRERARMRRRLSDEFDVYPSSAPFLLLDLGDRDVDELLANARAAGIEIRDARTFAGLDSHVRVAVHLPAENTRVLELFEEF